VLTSDPRIVPAARPVPLLTFEEAAELAFFGATVLHPSAMQPALQTEGLDVRVKNSYNRCAVTACPASFASRLLHCRANVQRSFFLPAYAKLPAGMEVEEPPKWLD
jgi:aspartokinase